MSLYPVQYSPSQTPPASPEESASQYQQITYPPKKRSGGNKMPRMLADGSELVWPPDLEAALFEALALYPPMITRRTVTVYSPNGEPSEFANVGRCQLIQEYILKKTGKLRTRKQVASRLQRLRQTHKDDPRLMALLRSARRSPGRFSISGAADRQSSPKPFHGYDHNLPNMPSSEHTSGHPTKMSMGSLPSELDEDEDEDEDSGYVSDNGAYSTITLPKIPELGGLRTQSAANRENVPPSLGEAGWSSLDGSKSPSMSRRRLASNIPALSIQVDLPPPPPPSHFSAPLDQVHSGYYGSAVPNRAYLSAGCAGNEQPVTPLDQIFPTPNHPPELRRFSKRPAHFSQPIIRPEIHEGREYGLPQPASVIEQNSDGMFKGYRQPAPSNYLSPYSSPYDSPYSSPTGQAFSRPNTGINFEDTLQQSAPQTYYHRSTMPPFARQHSYQHAPRPSPQQHQPLTPYEYSRAHQSPLSSHYSGMFDHMQHPDYLPHSHQLSNVAGSQERSGSFAQAFGALELQSPVAIRPFFLGQERSSPTDLLTSSSEADTTPPATETPAPIKQEPGTEPQIPRFSPQSSMPSSLPLINPLQSNAHYYHGSGPHEQDSSAYYVSSADVARHGHGLDATDSRSTHARYDYSASSHRDQSADYVGAQYDESSGARYQEDQTECPPTKAGEQDVYDQEALAQSTAPIFIKVEHVADSPSGWSPSAYTNDTD